MITLEGKKLVFRFPEVHKEAACSIDFQRTLRIPDDGDAYNLPPGFGSFPLRHLDDYAARLPDGWGRRGGVLMPMHQAEAMWIYFDAGAYPFAVKIATGKINAVSGDGWSDGLNQDPQDYVVLPEQPWLDGYCVEEGVIRQFVAMPLGDGYTAEEQITGAAEHGGLQIVAYPMKAERYESIKAEEGFGFRRRSEPVMGCDSAAMGIAPGGRMEQELYADPYGLDAWDQRHSSRCFVTVANSTVWASLTGEAPPTKPPTAKQYTRAGLPWFDYYGGDAEAIPGAGKFTGLKSVYDMGKKKGKKPLPENDSVTVGHVITHWKKNGSQVREFGAED